MTIAPAAAVGESCSQSVLISRKDLMNLCKKNAKILESYLQEHGWIDAILFFYENVTDGGLLDIKLQEDWKFEKGTRYYYNGQLLRYDDPGNINFGYVGAILFPLVILCMGAGVNQISKYGFEFGSIATFFDDPRDQRMIKLGYDLYMQRRN